MIPFPHLTRFVTCLLLLAGISRAADVKSFGARGDGQADDTAAIQRAVDVGGAVQFPSGTYRLSRPVMIELDKTGFIALNGDATARIVMTGPGAAFQFIGTLSGSAAPAQIKPDVWARQRMPVVDGIEIIGAHPEADGIAADGTMQLTLTRVTVREARHGIRLHGRNRNAIISDVHIYHNRGIGIYYDRVDLHQSNITGAHISYNAGGGVVVRGGHVRNLQIANCDIESNITGGGPEAANILLDSTDGSVGEVTITGCTIQHNSSGPGSANIRVFGAGFRTRANREPTTEGQITISGNMLSDVYVNVHLRHTRGVALSGNVFASSREHDLLVEDSSNISVGANTIDRNPRYPDGNPPARGGIVFRRSRDCTLAGVHVSNIRLRPAAIEFEDCSRFLVTGISILDCDGVGMRLHNTRLTRVSNCLIRDDRPAANTTPSLVVIGGAGNSIVSNTFDRAPEIAAGKASVRDNEIVPRPGK